MHGELIRTAEEPHEHVEEVDADVHREAAGLVLRAFPRAVVPGTAASDVGEVDLALSADGCGRELLLERLDRGVQSELQHDVDVVVALGLDLGELVQVPRADHERFLADRVRLDPQREAAVRVVEVVGRADAHIVHALGRRAPPQLLEVAVKALDFREEARLREVAVEDPHRVVRVDRRDQLVARVSDGLEVLGGDVAGRTEEREVGHTRQSESA